jgi:hypothetical protein
VAALQKTKLFETRIQRVVVSMAISNELSSDIAVALIGANDKDPRRLKKLKEILIEVHATLQQMTERSKAARSFARAASETDQGSRNCSA